MQESIYYYYNSIMKELDQEIRDIRYENTGAVEKQVAIAQLKIEAFKAATCMACTVYAFLSAMPNE